MQRPKSAFLFTCPFIESVKVAGSKTDSLTSDAGGIPMQLVMVITGIARRLASVLVDDRHPSRITHSLQELVRQLLLQHVQGWGRQTDADKLRRDPAMRVVPLRIGASRRCRTTGSWHPSRACPAW